MRIAAALAALLALALTACGDGATTTRAERPTVFAAASLTAVLPRIQPHATYEFGGSNALELQIERGAPADVFASASRAYVRRLQAKKLTSGAPAWFLANRVVLIVPRANPAGIRSPRDLLRNGVRLVLAAPGVPAGDYARRSLRGMHLDAALRNVVSEEPDVEGVVAKVASGDADAGFVYGSDARAVAGKVRTVPLPRSGRSVAVYGAVALAGARHPAAARSFVRLLLSERAQRLFRAAGFGPAPGSR